MITITQNKLLIYLNNLFSKYLNNVIDIIPLVPFLMVAVFIFDYE